MAKKVKRKFLRSLGVIVLLSTVRLVTGYRVGLISRPFYGRPDIRELECSGSGLDATYDVMSLVVYRVPQDNVLASAQVLKRHCATSGATFSSCLIDVRDTRRSKLKVLVTDPWGGQRGVYGCNVTSFWADGRATITSWFLEFVTPPGFTARTFHGYPPITEVECTGSDLAPDLDILSIVIYLSRTDHVVASANLGKKECSTSRAFSSCDFDARDSRRTRVRVLATGGDGGVEERWRVLGCNLTSFETGGRVRTVTLMLSVDPRTSLKATPFYGLSHITEVRCSGHGLPTGVDLLSITLYDTRTNQVLASVNYAQRKCVTAGGFTACHIDGQNSRHTVVKTLVSDLQEDEVRTYGCDVAVFEAGERPSSVSWSLAVQRISMRAMAFQGNGHITEVECSGEVLDTDTDLLTMVLYHVPDKQKVATANLKSGECSTSDQFSSCLINIHDSHRTKLRTLVLDLVEGELRHFGCNLTTFKSDGSTDIVSWTIYATSLRTTTTVAPTTTTSTTTTIRPQPPSESPVASGVKSNVQEFQLPISVIIIGLVLLLFFAILCAILVILQCRGKRRRRSRAANRESLLSAKNEPMGEGGYRTPRNIPSYPPGHMPPETPGGNFAMRYQKSIPDTGYVSGSSVYYSEPYGTLDEEMKERLRPNPRMCHIPYDIKGGPLDTAHPQEHSA